ncbi:MlaA family lipoprotein [Pararhodospirillum oryzae]|uniref:ABC transporter n=1 Tax=Pararhodospirillum oryzae TaxID=478448 RepID=A0A512H5M7_9PROT|nr:VacJ family lipoprotein [Pararhodospirillum oryzae]GEO80738.1 hypothetical protein ROR02_08690 [Pararhodospirillum oryzae]
MANSFSDSLRSFGGVVRAGTMALALCAVAACASTAPETGDSPKTTGELVADPMEPWNRYVFAVNDVVYTFMRPWIAPYMVLPDEGKEAVDNLIHNIKSPVILLNDLLQGEFERAWVTTGRFLINTTVGLFGLFDVAEGMGMPKHDEDFGQTLGTWGLGDGPYMVLPLLGPSNPRDALGAGVDMVSHPLFWVPGGDTGTMISAGRTYGSAATEYGGHVSEMDALRKTSLDYYATVRSLYIQMRRAQVRNIDPKAGEGAAVDYFPDDGTAQ